MQAGEMASIFDHISKQSWSNFFAIKQSLKAMQY